MEPSDYKPLHPEVHDYLDGKLSAEDERRFERRMDSNEELAEQVSNLRNAIAVLDTVRDYQIPEGFDERVIGRCREADLVENARSQIKPALGPFWQPLVHVAMGAVAAAIVVAVIGLPGGSEQPQDTEPALAPPLESIASVATEEDLLPALGDQFNRFQNLQRQVKFVAIDDADMFRESIRVELELTEIPRRNYWLKKEISGLPEARRIEYVRFLDGLADAFTAIDNELIEAQNMQRAPRTEVLESALASVEVPSRLREECTYSLRRSGSGPSDDLGTSRIGVGNGDPQVRSYTRIREALYRHDYRGMYDASRRYLAEFPQGKFVDAAQLFSVIALLRESDDSRAAKRFVDYFGEHDGDMTREQLALIAGMMDSQEFARLKAAQRKLQD
ncbi:MAG: anti-sigma factor family protein [Planctomycetota bacterium]|jgi:hypothetical protein